MTNNFCFVADKGSFYFRVFGFGLQMKSPQLRPLFSERSGHTKPLVVLGGYRLFWLKRNSALNLRDESGQAMVLTAFCMVALIGFLALAIDVGMVFNAKRKLQIAADAAATAAAVRYIYGYNTTAATAAGQTAALANDPAATSVVTVNANPASPSVHKLCSAPTCYFEAVVTKNVNTVFFGVFYNMFTGTRGTGTTLHARAVAGTPSPIVNCAYLTNPVGIAMTTQGKWDITSTCGLYINSSSQDPEDDTGKSAKSGVSASLISQVGPLPSNITIASGSPAQSVQQTLPENIPYGNVTPPNTTPCSSTWKPVAGCYSGNVTLTTATLGSGTYVFTGNVTVNGKLSGTGVTLDINTGNLIIKPGGSSMTFTPPTSGALAGVVIYMPPSNNNSIQLEAGSTQVVFPGGWVVAPSATLSEQDNGGGVSVGGLVVNNVNMGPSSLAVTGVSSSSSSTRAVALVE